MIADIHMSGLMVKTMSHQKRCSETMRYGELRTNRGPGLSTTSSKSSSSSAHRRYYCRKVQAQHLFQHQLNVGVQMSKHGAARCLTQPRTVKPVTFRNTRMAAGIQRNLVDERAPELRDSHASSSHEPSLEPQRRVVSGTHCI